MAAIIPSTVVAGRNIFDTTNAKQIGTVASGSGSLTLVLTGNASNAGSGSNDTLLITDANLATYQAQLTALS